jgi:hypothetical protein
MQSVLNLLNRANTWLKTQIFNGGIFFNTVPQTTQNGYISNTGYGTGALNSNSGDNGNSAFGYNALHSNTTGNLNAVYGYQAMYSNTTGGANTAVGYQAMYSNTTNIFGTAVGYKALQNNTTGVGNSAFGNAALYNYNNTASANGYITAIGFHAGYNYTGAELNNTVLGAVSGVKGESNVIRVGNNNGTLLYGVETNTPSTDYLSIAGNIATGNGGTAPTAVTVPASGVAYTPSTTINTILYVSGGSVTGIAINGVATGLTSGVFPLKANDTITFYYALTAPTVYQMSA